MKDTTDQPPILQRVLWFVALWASGVLAVTILGAIIRWWLLGG